jgi:hypothetical protein
VQLVLSPGQALAKALPLIGSASFSPLRKPLSISNQSPRSGKKITNLALAFSVLNPSSLCQSFKASLLLIITYLGTLVIHF